MEKMVFMGLLLDFYGPSLTPRQRSLMELYCQEDYSLAEIAQLHGISRQGVRDALKRAERTLNTLEDQLQFASRYTALRHGLQELASDLSNSGQDGFAARIDALLRDWEGQ
jgi:predicted DNA-binding protein YlxM (UPF0122 family)